MPGATAPRVLKRHTFKSTSQCWAEAVVETNTLPWAKDLRHLFVAFTIEERLVFWGDHKSTERQARYQKKFLEQHPEARSDPKAHHWPVAARPNLTTRVGTKVLSSHKMPWIESVIYTADVTADVNLARIKEYDTMNVFNVPIVERRPVMEHSCVLQSENVKERHIRRGSVETDELAEHALTSSDLLEALEGNVCVSCYAGKNRSTSALIAYLMSRIPQNCSNGDLSRLLPRFKQIYNKVRISSINLAQLHALDMLRRNPLYRNTFDVPFADDPLEEPDERVQGPFARRRERRVSVQGRATAQVRIPLDQSSNVAGVWTPAPTRQGADAGSDPWEPFEL